MIRALFRGSTVVWTLGALIAAGIIHILAVFAAAEWSGPLTQPLENVAPVNAMTVLPPIAAGSQILPFQAGDQRIAVCPFDLTGGPVLVRASFGEGLWSVAVLDRNGATLYAVSNAELQRQDATLVLARTSEVKAASLPISRQAAESNITVNMPTTRGVTLIRGPVLGVAFEAETERVLRQANCKAIAAGADEDAPPAP